MLDQVEEGRFGPVDVVEHHDKWTFSGEVFEQLTDGPERVFGSARLAPTEEAAHETCDPLAVRSIGDECREPIARGRR